MRNIAKFIISGALVLYTAWSGQAFAQVNGTIPGQATTSIPGITSYGTTAGTAAQGNDSRITGAVQTNAVYTNSAQPIFSAYMAGNQTVSASGSSLVNFDTTIRNQASFFNTTTHVGTAPTTGTYLCTAIIYIVSGQTTGEFAVSLTATSRIYDLFDATITSINLAGNFVVGGSALVDMTSGDTVRVNVFSGVSASYVIGGASSNRSFFQCALLY